MFDNEKLEDYEKPVNIPKPPPRNGSLRTNLSESEDGLSESCKDYEGESVDDLDIPYRQPLISRVEKPINSKFYKNNTIPFPKKPCFSEFDDNDKLEYHGPICQIVQKLTSSRKSRYAVLMSDKLILFEKPEHKVSKVQIPVKSMKGIDWVDTINCSNKNDCNKFKLDTPVRSYKFQCTSHENAGVWINHIGKLIFDKQNVGNSTDTYVLKAFVSLENVKRKRIFTIEPKFTIAYYDSEDDFKYGIAMHRIQLRSSGVKRDGTDNSFTLITSYRKYKMTFETIAQCNEWFQAISVIIQKAISSTCSRNAKSGEEIMSEISKNSSNKFCAECKSDKIEWASVNLFITLCSKCSGLHRKLGPNISKVQGIFTDESTWENHNVIKLFEIIGNNNANDFWMSNYSDENCEIDFKFINDKYGRKKFIEKKENIFEKYKDTEALNEEFLECIKTGNVLRTMRLFHIGADLNVLKANETAEQFNQIFQLTYLKNQCKSQVRDWRDDLFEVDDDLVEQTPFQERYFCCSIDHQPKENRVILIWKTFIQILDNDITKKEICKVLFRNICLVREHKLEPDGLSLIIVVQESEYSTKYSENENCINLIEFFGTEIDQSNDIKDFKNVIGQNLSPNFTPTFSYACIGWVILCTVSDDWKPYLLAINYNSIANFYSLTDFNNEFLKLDLRKVSKIEELKDSNYENVCPFKMYNLASICLMSSVIYHIRGDTKESHEELYKAFLQSWNDWDFTSISNQFLTQNNIPLAVSKMIKYLQIHGTQIEGLFRRGGSVREAEKIYNQLITDPNYVLTNCDAHDVASALKIFFRKLDDPLLTRQFYGEWMSAINITNSEEKFNYFKKIIKKLPLINYQTLRLLIFLLVSIDKNNDVTQMNPENLSTSFNTCLLASSNEEAFNRRNLQILPFLITNYQGLFDVTQGELEIEIMYNKERLKIKECPQTETSLLRQIYILPELECFLKKDINFERESGNKKSDYFKELLVKQLRIEQSMTSKELFNKLFKENNETPNILMFEDRKIEDFHMEHLIYPYENLIEVIQLSEKSDSLPKKWIFKSNKYVELESKLTFERSAYFSSSNKNKVLVELKTNEINIWKKELTTELLINIPIKDLILFRSCEKDKYLVAFEDKKSQTSTLPSVLQLFAFKSRSSYNFITFFSEIDYHSFLQYYDQLKLSRNKSI